MLFGRTELLLRPFGGRRDGTLLIGRTNIVALRQRGAKHQENAVFLSEGE